MVKNKYLSLKTIAVAMLMVLFAMPGVAQTVYMHNGSMTVGSSSVINFYDSGGASSGPEYYWERWFNRNETSTFTFTPEDGRAIKVTFEKFTAYLDNGGTNHAIGADWSLRLNTAELSIYDGATEAEENLITTYTGNMTGEFSVMAHGPMTFVFHSYSYREEGWQAKVESVDLVDYELMAPQISFEACTDDIIINANNSGVQIYYTTSGDDPVVADPLTGATLYVGPFHVEAGTTIKAIAYDSESVTPSPVASKEFTSDDVTPTPGLARIERSGNTIIMTPADLVGDINETYYVWYTTDGYAPSLNHGQRYEGPFEWTTPGTTFMAVTRALTCSDKISTDVTTFVFDKVQVPDPTIEFDAEGHATIACNGYTINYTIGGSDPSVNATGGYDNQVVTAALTPGTTVKAVAYKVTNGAIDSEYKSSSVVSVIYIPTDEQGNPIDGGVIGDVVLLDDREDHSWSYYSDGDQPIHSLKPADVKITYFGNGTGTVSTTDGPTPANDSWTADATGVQVGPNESGNQFIYLKTLENAKEDGTGNYPYTTIPNPFSKRPTYTNVVATRDIYFSTVQDNAFGYIYVTYYDAYGVQQQWEGHIYWTYEDGKIEPSTTITVKAGTEVTIRLRTIEPNGDNSWVGTDGNHEVRYTARYDGQTGSVVSSDGLNVAGREITRTFTVEEGGSSAGSVTTNDYRGFYAWRVKRLSSGLTIKRANGTNVGVNGIINAEEAIQFVTSNEDGNEVDFEALWAKAYVVSYNGNYAVTVTNTTVGFERNFVVLERNGADLPLGGDGNHLNNPNNRAVTVSSYYPDGTQGANRCGIDFGGDLDLNYDLKLEYVQNRDYANSTSYINANGHYLYIGRGMTANNTIAAQINAIRSDGDASNTRIRLESGNYSHIHVLAGEYGTEGQTGLRFHTLLTFGTDYDRATKDNNKLIVAPTNGEITFGNRYPLYGTTGERRINASINRRERTLTCITKSGKFQQDQFGNTVGSNSQSFYIGTTGESNSYSGKRYLMVEGGEFACIAGGRGPKASGDDNTYPTTTAQYVDRNDTTATIRIRKGAIIHGGVYGGAAASAAWGNRKVVITGGLIEGWVAGGCNGTQQQDYGGRGIGDSYIYIGGNAIIGGETPNTIPVGYDNNGNLIPGTVGGNVFGAGRGSFGGETVPSSMENSYVVIADGCDILHSVYGGGNLGRIFEGEDHAANVYILGGTIHENVYGGANLANSQKAFVHIKDGVVEGSVYGGCNTNGKANGIAVINMTGGSVHGSVYGGGLGGRTNDYEGTIMNGGTEVNISGGTIINNVYGGGEEGTVTNGGTHVNISGGTMQHVYGAGKGSASSTALVTGQTFVNISGGTVTNVYGGGEAGAVDNGTNVASTVVINGGNVGGSVFGGGFEGTTTGNTIVNLESGSVRGDVFGGAFGKSDKVFVAGTHSVNIMGGRVFSSVYGGSRNADDALSFTDYDENELRTNSVVNISAGQVDEQVYAAGYLGQTFGSIYVFVGKNAILNAPNCAPIFGNENENKYKPGILILNHSIWAGSDWGTFSGGQFGAPTVSGYSNIYVDGVGYNSETHNESLPTYMNIKGSILGCGTSCDAGKQGRGIYIRNYGKANLASSGSKEPFDDATRSLYSVQRADTLVFDNAHLNLTGQAKVNSLDATEKYGIYSFDKTVRMVGGSSLFMNAPTTQIIDFWSATVDDLYKGMDANYTEINYDGLGATGGPVDNKIRVNGGNYIEIYHDKMPYEDENHTIDAGYGMLKGFAHMMLGTGQNDNICAYARPKQSVQPGNIIPDEYNNRDDGGWVSYGDLNLYNIQGGLVSDGVQIPYENHTPDLTKVGEKYFRIWRIGDYFHVRDGVFNAHADGSDSWNYVDVTIKLPAWRGEDHYYCFESENNGAGYNTTIDYGPDVLTFNSALTTLPTDASSWIHYNNAQTARTQQEGWLQSALDLILSNPNINFGLVTLAGTGMRLVSPQMVGGDEAPGLIVCQDSDDFLARKTDDLADNRFTCDDYLVKPEVTFRLTFSNTINSNMSWDPMYITLVQCDKDGKVKDIVKISLTINTFTTIDQEFTTETYALMNGQGATSSSFTAKVTLPTFELKDVAAEHLSEFYLESVTFAPETGEGSDAVQGSWIDRGSGYDINNFAMMIGAANNEDNSDGWNGTSTGMHDSHSNIPTGGIYLGNTGGRTPFAFDFTLYYNGNILFNGANPNLGVLTFNLKFNNYSGNENVDDFKDLIIKVKVIRRGVGKIWYIDGQNGSNQYNALNPDQAALSLSWILNRLNYLPGDLIYIVNEVDIDNSTVWSGTKFDQVTIYRYPGGHPCVTEAGIIGNEENAAYTGPLINVVSNGNLTIRDVTLDGHMNIHNNPWPGDEIDTDPAVSAQAPMINVSNNGSLVLTTGSLLQNNNNVATNGGAITVDEEGTLMMNRDAVIYDNKTNGNGGAVYMDGTMIVSDQVYIYNNKNGNNQNNVYLCDADDMITIGTSDSTDDYGELFYDPEHPGNPDNPFETDNARIGVSKVLYGDIDGYTRVVNVDSENDIPWFDELVLRRNHVVFHDGDKYQLEEYEDPLIRYWIGTWVTEQDHIPTEEEGGWAYQTDINDPIGTNDKEFDIYTKNQLAWIISLVNGENHQPRNDFSGKTIRIHNDLDMQENIWVAIGNSEVPFKGTFEGNGHVIEGIHSVLVAEDAGVFGNTEDAVIDGVVAVVQFDGNNHNKGTFIGTMRGGSLSNVEAAGELVGKRNTINMGGLVGLAMPSTGGSKPVIHSGFSVNHFTAEKTTTVVGGLVGNNGANLYNSYANATLGSEINVKGGLVGINQPNCTVENCYVINPINPEAAFVAQNSGSINYCYAHVGIDPENYVAETIPVENEPAPVLKASGKYNDVLLRKAIGYMYDDNKVVKSIEEEEATNPYIADTVYYNHGRIEKWDGLLSTLNQWVVANPVGLNPSPTPWFRPTTQNINGDLPVLGFSKDNCMGTLNSDKRYLRYGSNVDSNGLDLLLSYYDDNGLEEAEPDATIFHYGVATGVAGVPTENVEVYVNEDAVLKQTAGAADFINTTVGITFDNSCQNALDYWGNTLHYDWHFLSSSLRDATMGTTYSNNTTGYGGEVTISTMVDNYLPNDLPMSSGYEEGVKWDLYSYLESQYHWINLKRATGDHWHVDGDHEIIDADQYTNDSVFVPGKGYMMAISQDSYLSSKGTLNNDKDGGVKIDLTCNEPDVIDYNKGWNLVGNPFQAYLDLGQIGGSKYIYDADQGVYAPVTNGQSSNPCIPSLYIHPHQGFFMYTSSNTEFTFDYDWAVSTKDNASYYRGSEGQVNYPLINLFAENERGNRDLTVIELHRPELGGATKVNGLRNANFQVAASFDGKRYGILFTPEGTERVPVHFRTEEDGTYTLRWNTHNGDFTSLRLIDNMTGVNCDMLANDHYTFEATTDDYASRFYITYECIGVEEEFSNETDNFAFFDGSEWVVNGKGHMDVIDMMGHVLYTEQLNNDHNRVDLSGVAKGVYLLRVIDNKVERTQKIIVR